VYDIILFLTLGVHAESNVIFPSRLVGKYLSSLHCLTNTEITADIAINENNIDNDDGFKRDL